MKTNVWGSRHGICTQCGAYRMAWFTARVPALGYSDVDLFDKMKGAHMSPYSRSDSA